MKNLFYFMLGLTAVLVAAVASADEYATVFVPEGKKVVVVDEKVEGCWFIYPLPLPEASDDEPEEEGLVVGGSQPD